MIHKISFALRPILACFLFISSISFDRSKKSRRRLKKWNEKPADIHNITLFRWSALCGGSRPEHRMKMSTTKKSRDIFLISTRERTSEKKGQEEIHLCSFFYITSSWAFRSVLTTMLPTLTEAWMSYVDWESKVRKLTCFTLCLLLRYITVRDDDDDDVGESVRRVFSPRLAVLTLRNPPRIPKLQRFFTLNFLSFPTSFFASFRFFFRTRKLLYFFLYCEATSLQLLFGNKLFFWFHSNFIPSSST